MAYTSSTKTPCATCDCKSLGILKCEGCSQKFCRKHVLEHRDMLTQQLDDIVLGHDMLQQILNTQNDQEDKFHSILNEIDRWEKESITKIEQTAKEAREQVKIRKNLRKDIRSNELKDLTEQLRKARIDDNYIETDLQLWTNMLEDLKHDITTKTSSITICEDPTKILVTTISVISTTEQYQNRERFGETYGSVRIENNSQVAKHCGEKSNNAYLSGVREYLSGQHQIRFIINKKATERFIFFWYYIKRTTSIENILEVRIFRFWLVE